MEKNISNLIFVCHCVFNKASKVYEGKTLEPKEEEIARVKFLKEALENNINLIQLPCPEFIMYGSERWGHSRCQFNNPIFKENCRELLKPYILQIKTYLSNKEKFNVLGIVGIEGSPSCGVNISFDGKWGGEFSSIDSLREMLNKGDIENKKGIFIEVLSELLEENQIKLPIVGLNNGTLSKLINPLD